MAPPERRIEQLVAEARAHISRELLAHPMIALCVENMQRTADLKPLEIVEMFVTVFCFIRSEVLAMSSTSRSAVKSRPA